jgi:uncharacterized protein (TIGR02001 family)
MKSISIAALLIATTALARPESAAGQGAAPGLDGYLTLGTGYWNRGLSQNDDGLSLQLGVDYQHRTGFFVGGELADVDYAAEDPRNEPRELEMDTYLGFHRRNTEWSWTLTLARYLYPDSTTRFDYSEISASVGFRDRIFFRTSYTDDFLSLRRSALNSELTMALPLAWNLELSAALGRFDVDVTSTSEYTHWNVGLSKVARRVVLDLRYYDNSYELVTPLGDPASNRFVLSVSYAFRGTRMGI